ncbi:MAG: hypothetical protein PWP49_222 [Thermococcaceae archaeon]|nr:hypothetical protein [Thermococcaceae archaeon]
MGGNNLLVITNIFPNEDGSYYQGVFVKEQIKFLKDYFDNVYVISPWPYGYKMFLKNYSYENVYVYYPRFIHFPIGYFRRRLGENYYKAILKVIKRENLKFKIVHAHFTWPSGYATHILKRTHKIPFVVTTHGLHDTRMNFLLKNGAMEVWKSADAIINVSRKCVKLLMRVGIPEDKLYYIPNGVDTSLFYPQETALIRKELNIPIDKKILISVGNLVEKKGFEYLIRAMKIILHARDDVLLYIIGEGPLRKRLENITRELKLEEHVFLVGPKPHRDIPLWINAGDLFVLPSLVENFGVVNIEALACGKPVISTINGGSEEVITSEEYGLLCPPRDPECLAEKILMALNKEWDREKIRKYAEQFDWRNIARQIFKVYEDVLSNY